MAQKVPCHFCDCLTCKQPDVMLATVVEKHIFHISVRMDSTDVLTQLKISCTSLDVTLKSSKEFYNIDIQRHFNVGRSVKMSKTLWKNSLKIAKYHPCKFHCYCHRIS
jgi:hypothetical protein